MQHWNVEGGHKLKNKQIEVVKSLSAYHRKPLQSIDLNCLLASSTTARSSAGLPTDAVPPPDHHLRLGVLPDHHLRPEVAPNNHLTPGVIPDHHLRPGVLLDHHLSPGVLPDHHLRLGVLPDLRPGVLSELHLRPEVTPDHYLTPELHWITAEARSFAGPPPEAQSYVGLPPDHRLTSEFCQPTARLPIGLGTSKTSDICLFPHSGQNPVGEGTSGPIFEDRIQKMEESHNEILQLLRETRGPVLAPPEKILLPRDPPGLEDVQPEQFHIEIPLPPLRMRPLTHQDIELADTASSTHPSRTDRQPHIPPDAPENLARPHIAELPRNALQQELQRLINKTIMFATLISRKGIRFLLPPNTSRTGLSDSVFNLPQFLMAVKEFRPDPRDPAGALPPNFTGRIRKLQGTKASNFGSGTETGGPSKVGHRADHGET
ncbi:hypothetical protein M5K25_024234 [Dendrobium thyrsiflorum]|uniref:Uncharacterized protein n=1 Tax=Dendrobium thyrsiflorum TaxID=117978 RepID=A0ABD0U1V8_DENTH